MIYLFIHFVVIVLLVMADMAAERDSSVAGGEAIAISRHLTTSAGFPFFLAIRQTPSSTIASSQQHTFRQIHSQFQPSSKDVVIPDYVYAMSSQVPLMQYHQRSRFACQLKALAGSYLWAELSVSLRMA